MSLRVLTASSPLLPQDCGRIGWSDQGVGTSGAFDRSALRQANYLVSNADGTAVVEITGGGTTLRASRDHIVAVTGAVGPLWIDGRPVASHRTLRLAAGSTLKFGNPTLGVRWTLAVAGGIDVEPVLGSSSRDTLAGLGPGPWQAGDLIQVGLAPNDIELRAIEPLLAPAPYRVGLIPGPRDDWFTADALSVLFTYLWRVSALTDRVGTRLDGPALERERNGELLSEPVIRGSIQVTGDGSPIVLGPDHPVTGGYPVIAVVVDADLDRFAQMRPGDAIWFERVTKPRTD